MKAISGRVPQVEQRLDSARSALALVSMLGAALARVTIRSDSEPDDELDVLTERGRALRRLSPIKLRLLTLIASEMLREARDR